MVNVIAKDILEIFKINQFVETGIYLGTQIKFVSDWLIEMYGDDYKMLEIDLNGEFVENAKKTYKNNKNIDIFEGCSSVWLKKMVDSQLFDKKRTMFFLDAHWNEYIPLRDELTSLLKLKNKPIIAIDDFYNPFDSGNFSPGNGFWMNSNLPCGTEYIRDLLGDRVDVIVHAKNAQSELLEKYGLGCGGNHCAFLFVDEGIGDIMEKLETISDHIQYYPLKVRN